MVYVCAFEVIPMKEIDREIVRLIEIILIEIGLHLYFSAFGLLAGPAFLRAPGMHRPDTHTAASRDIVVPNAV
jgi:hypothetical protein